MASLDDTDPSFTSRPPLLTLLEPALLLSAPSLGAARLPIRNRDILHAHGPGDFFVHLRVETGIGSRAGRNPAELAAMRFHRWNQQVLVTRPLFEHLVVRDDLVLCL